MYVVFLERAAIQPYRICWGATISPNMFDRSFTRTLSHFISWIFALKTVDGHARDFWFEDDSLLTQDRTSSRNSVAKTLHPTTPCRAPRCSYTPVVALSAVSSVSQGCRSYIPPPPPPQRARSHPIPHRGCFGALKPCCAPRGGAATLASVALHFDMKGRKSAEISGLKLPLWAAFPLLIHQAWFCQ